MLGECPHNVALRQYAGETPSRAENDHRADAARGKQLCCRCEIGRWFDRNDVAAQLLGGQDRLHVHGSLLMALTAFQNAIMRKSPGSHRDDPRVRATCNDPARPPVPSTRISVRSATR